MKLLNFNFNFFEESEKNSKKVGYKRHNWTKTRKDILDWMFFHFDPKWKFCDIKRRVSFKDFRGCIYCTILSHRIYSSTYTLLKVALRVILSLWGVGKLETRSFCFSKVLAKSRRSEWAYRLCIPVELGARGYPFFVRHTHRHKFSIFFFSSFFLVVKNNYFVLEKNIGGRWCKWLLHFG